MTCPGSLGVVLLGGFHTLVLFPFNTPSPGSRVCADTVGGSGDCGRGWGEIDHIPALMWLTEYNSLSVNNQVSR